MRGTWMPQSRILSLYCTSSPRSVRPCTVSRRGVSGVGALDERREVGDVVGVAIDVDEPALDLEVIDLEAPAVDHPRQLDLDALRDQERAVLVALRREAHAASA